MIHCSGRQRKPNILLILTDDQGWGDIHSHGNAVLDTPTLDRLAASGARFDRFYVSPVCAPTRASLLTGRYHLRTHVHGVTRGQETLYSEEVTIAEILKKAGYATGCFGKWHNGAHYPYHPNGQGFDEFIGFCAGHWNNYIDTHLEHNGQRIESLDRVPRKEVYEQTWGRLDMGRLHLPKGRYTLAVKALSRPGGTVMDLKAVILTRK